VVKNLVDTIIKSLDRTPGVWEIRGMGYDEYIFLKAKVGDTQDPFQIVTHVKNTYERPTIVQPYFYKMGFFESRRFWKALKRYKDWKTEQITPDTCPMPSVKPPKLPSLTVNLEEYNKS